MRKHEEATPRRKEMEHEHQEKVKDPENIFRSKLFLALEDQAIEEVFNANYSSRNNILNIITSIILIFYTIFCFIYFPNFKCAVTQFEKLSIYFSIELVICLITLVISMLIYFQKRISILWQYKFKIENSIMGVNYFLLYTHLIISFVIYDDSDLFNKLQLEIYVFFSVLSTVIKIMYVVFFIRKFTIIFTTSVILYFTYFIILKYILLHKSSYPAVSQLLILLVCNIIIYINEVSEKINLHLLNNPQKISGANLAYTEGISSDSHRQICENLKSSIVKFDKDGLYSYANNSMKKLVVSLGMISKETCMHENEYEKLTQNTAEKENVQVIYNRINYLKFFMNNKICNDEDKSEMIGQPLLKSEGDQIQISNFISAFQTILNNITYVNDELHYSNLKLFEYLQKLKNKNLNNLNDQENPKTSSTLNKEKEKEVSSAFALSDLIKLISNQNNTMEKEHPNKINHMRSEKTKLTELNVANPLDKNTYIKINENSELNISKDCLEKKEAPNNLFLNNMKTFKSGYPNSSNINNLNTLNNETLNVVLDRLKTKNIESNEEQVFLGIVLIPGSSASSQNKNQIFPAVTNKYKEDKEYYIHYLILPNGEVVFTLEDLSLHIKKERSETSNICRSLYLSKFSHELKNPICNMLEIIEFLNQELVQEENKTKLNTDYKFLSRISNVQDSRQNLIFESPSENSSGSEEENSKKNQKTDHKFKSINYLSKDKTCDKSCNQGIKFLDFKKTISQNVKMLKSIGDMLILIFKDFNFYSNLLINEETRPLPVLSNNFDRLNSKRKTSKLFSTKIVNKSQNFQKDPPAQNPNFINSFITNNMNFIISNKTCNYKQILTEVIQIFSSKSEIDKKSSKINFELFFAENIPNTIECDKEKFNSMLFNIFYHLYITTVSGKIVVRVELNNKLQDIQSNKKINFEIFVNGITNFNKNSFMDRELLGDMNLEKENLIEEKETILPVKGNLNSPQLLNELERKSDVNNLNNLNNLKEAPNQFVEYLQVNNILNITNPHKRNSIIDSFNKNFQFFISYIYSIELGIKIKFSNDKNKMRIFFQYDLPTNMETNDEAKYSDCDVFDESRHKIKRNSLHSNLNANDYQNKKKRLSKFFKVSKETPLVFDNNSESSCSIAKKSLPEITLSYDSQRTEKLPHDRKFDEKATYQKLNKLLSINTGENLEDPVKIINNDTCVINKNKIIINNKFYLDTNTINESVQHPKIRVKKTNTDKNVVRHNEVKQPQKRLSNIMFFPRSRTKQSSKKSGLKSCATFHKRGKNIRLSNKIIPRRSIENVCRVILCDDEYLIRKTLNRFLETYSKENTKINFEIDHAENGYECLSLIYKSHNEGIYYDVLIIDETMPFIKGSQMIFLLKSMIMDGALKNITIVSFTSYDSPDKVEYIYSQGADYVISKPMKYDDFKIFLTDEILTNRRNHSSGDDDEEE